MKTLSPSPSPSRGEGIWIPRSLLRGIVSWIERNAQAGNPGELMFSHTFTGKGTSSAFVRSYRWPNSDLFSLRPQDLDTKTKEKPYVNARSILCYWSTRELGISMTELARRLDMTQPAVSYMVRRGRMLVDQGDYDL